MDVEEIPTVETELAKTNALLERIAAAVEKLVEYEGRKPIPNILTRAAERYRDKSRGDR